jgi:hypothetical protein
MTRQVGRLALAVGLGAFLASGCTPSWAGRCPGPDPLRGPAPAPGAAVNAADPPGSSYNPQSRGSRPDELPSPDIKKVIHHPDGDKPREEPEATATPAAPAPPAPPAGVGSGRARLRHHRDRHHRPGAL